MAFLLDICGYTSNFIGYFSYRLALHLVSLWHRFYLGVWTRILVSDSDECCSVQDIRWKRKFFMIDVVSPSDFLAVHSKYCASEYVLQPNVTLYTVTKDYVYFVESDSNVDVCSSAVNPFQYIGQFLHARRVVVMSWTSLCRLASRLGDPECTVLFMPNTGRCGSTILAQALENIPGTLLHSEPDSLTNIGHLRKKGELTQLRYEENLVAMFRYPCRPRHGVERVCIKTRSCASVHLPVISKHFPNCKFIFGYRNSLKTVSSFLGLMISETAQSLAMYLIDSDQFSSMVPYFRNIFYFYFCYMLDGRFHTEKPASLNTVEQFTYAWANVIAHIKQFQAEGGKVMPIAYEDMVADTEDTLREVFEELNIDKKHMDSALKAFRGDSQAGSPLSMSNISNAHRRKVKPVDILRSNRILKMFGLPNLGEPFVLPDTRNNSKGKAKSS